MKTEIASLLLQKYGKKNPPELRAGDTVRVHQKIKEGDKERVQIFEGLVIATKHGSGLNGTFTVRKIAAGGVGVERVYPLHSPNVVKVERLKTAEVSRAKLYYMRDRLGKAARFKKEVRSLMSWSESGITTIVEPEIGTTDEENNLAEAVMAAEVDSATELNTVPETDLEVAAESEKVDHEVVVADTDEAPEIPMPSEDVKETIKKTEEEEKKVS